MMNYWKPYEKHKEKQVNGCKVVQNNAKPKFYNLHLKNLST
jgi:hypothetical protein